MSGTTETDTPAGPGRKPRILTLDIETSPMLVYTFQLDRPFIAINQIVDHTRMLCWAAKWLGEDQVIYRSEFHHGRDKMLSHLHELLSEADIVVHFNGDSFDIPHCRREFKQAGLPVLPPLKTVDLWKASKKQFYFPSYKLDYIAQALGVGAKVHHSGFQLWRDCIEQSPADNPHRQKRAWSVMRKYNKGDVIVTEDLYVEILPYIANHPHIGLYADDPIENSCANCGSEDLQNRGFSLTKVGKYQRYQCKGCGAWGRYKKSIAFVDARPA